MAFGWLNGCHLYIARRVIYQIDTSIRCVQICVNKSFRKPFHSPKHWRPKKKKEKKKGFSFLYKPKVIVARNYTLCLTFSLKFPNTRTIYCTLIEAKTLCGEWRQSQQTFLHHRTNSNRLACINLCWIFIRTQRQDYKKKSRFEILGDPSLRVNTQQLEMCIYCTASREEKKKGNKRRREAETTKH